MFGCYGCKTIGKGRKINITFVIHNLVTQGRNSDTFLLPDYRLVMIFSYQISTTMATCLKTLLVPVVLLCLLVPINAQDLKHLFEIAHYRLRTGAEDVNGVLDSMELDNAPIVPFQGVYSNGIYPGTDPENGANIRTPQVSSLYDDEFAIVLEFTISAIDGETRPIVILGQNDQYLGFEVRSDDTYAIIYNKTHRLAVPGLTPDLAIHELTIIHNQLTSHTEFYLGSTLIGELNVPLEREKDDGRITNANAALSRSFLGYWSNLFIYGSEDITAIRDHILEKAIRLTPNPANEFLLINAEDRRIKTWMILNASGQHVSKGNYQRDMQIDIRDLAPGMYFLQLLDEEGRNMVTRKFVRM